MTKIAITIAKLNNLENRIYTNGINQNIIFLYELLNNLAGLTVYFVSDLIDNVQKYKHFKLSNYSKLREMDIVILAGLQIDEDDKNLCIENGIKLIYWRFGNDYIYDIQNILENNKKVISCNHSKGFNEQWISPHFKYSIDYYKYIGCNKNVVVAPYFWKPSFLRQFTNKFDCSDINIGVFESNTNYSKSCFIPIIICERVKKIINKAYICCSKNMHDNNQKFRDFLNCSSLFKEKRLICKCREIFTWAINNICNLVVSYVDNCDLNYLFLECFYLGVPLIHNSKMLKDYGFYYEGCDVEMAAKHIINIKMQGFDREKYIAKHKVLLYKYSIENPATIHFFKTKLGIKDYAEKTVEESKKYIFYFLGNTEERVINYYKELAKKEDLKYIIKKVENKLEDVLNKINQRGEKCYNLLIRDNIIIPTLLSTNGYGFNYTHGMEIGLMGFNNTFLFKDSLLTDLLLAGRKKKFGEYRIYSSEIYFNYLIENLSCKPPIKFKEEDYAKKYRSKIALIQIYDKGIKEYGVFSQKSVQDYCDMHKYDYYVFRKKDTKYGGAYLKAKNILKIINNYNYVMYLDVDILITNMNYTIEDIVRLSDKDILACADPCPWIKLNTGALIFKNTENAKKILNVWNKENMDKGTQNTYSPNDQTLLINIISMDIYKDYIHIFEDPIFNTHFDKWSKNNFILHLMGTPAATRTKFMKNYFMREGGAPCEQPSPWLKNYWTSKYCFAFSGDYDTEKFIKVDKNVDIEERRIYSFVISVDENKKKEMVKKLKKDYVFIDIKKFPKDISKKSRQRIVCESHVKCWKKAIDAGLEEAFFFEDGVVFIKNWRKIVSKFLNDNNVNQIQFDCLPYRIKDVENSVLFYKAISRSCTGGYYLSRRAMEHHINYYESRPMIHIENFIYNASQKFTRYTSVPRICIQDWYKQPFSKIQDNTHLKELKYMQKEVYLPKYRDFFF